MPSRSAVRAAVLPRVLRDDAADTVRAIMIVLVAYVAMTVGDIAGKWALLPAGVAAVMLGRGVSGSVVIGALVLAEGDWRRVVPVRWRLVALRSVMHGCASITWYVAWQVMPLADAYALGFTAPLMMTLLAIPMLGETIRWRRAVSTVLGFSGVLIMVRPGSEMWRPELLILMPGIVVMAVSRTMTRVLSTTETPECLTFWLMLAHIPAGLALLLFGFPPPGPLSLGVLAALALLGGANAAGHWLMARAYAMGTVSALAPYEYTTLIWGGIGGYVVFHETLEPGTLAGAAVVAAAGLYNLHRERVRRTEGAAA